MCHTEFWLSRDRLLHNFRYIRGLLHKNTRILVNLKANAYGHGAGPIGLFLDDKADYFSVACQWEGEQLRKAGIESPVLVYNPPLDWNKSFFENQLTPAVYNVDQLDRLINFVRENRLGKIKVHIKIDTGMHRSGLMPEHVERMIRLLKSQSVVEPEGVFSHLAAADDPAEDDFTKRQIETFRTLSQKFFEINPGLIRHLANSSALLRQLDCEFDMVRPGLSIYGISPVEGEAGKKLKPVGQLVSRITQLREIGTGETVGYNRLFKARRPSKIALIPTGYADGYKRALGSGKGQVLLNGQLVPVIGKVSMDMITLDVTEVENVKIGDRVTLFGDKPGAWELARLVKTIPYEITTSVSARVRRVWKNF